ncbi:hypothetical protein [Nonomuraea rubra]|uniref:hypothetical protein n=1 Tax=Nonomuraea rubra TaxID=46180 RepID=UPI0033D656E8
MNEPELRLLCSRVDALIEDVRKVRLAVKDVKARASQLERVSTALRAAVSAVQDLESTVWYLPQRLQNLEDFDTVNAEDASLLAGLTATVKLSGDTRQHVLAARKAFSHIELSLVKIEEENTLIGELTSMCKSLEWQLGKMRTGLVTPAETPAALWNAYGTAVRDQARPIFDGYVDYIAGLAVRDDRLDQEICLLSDDMVKELLGWRSLSIPASEAALSLKSMVKLGYPEWTVWGVPLAAHEAGLGVLSKHGAAEGLKTALADFVEDFADYLGLADDLHAVDRPGLDEAAKREAAVRHANAVKSLNAYIEHLFADVLGAYAVGPAYARAMFELRLCPNVTRLAANALPADCDRARLILRVMALQAEPGGALGTEVGQLKQLWENAERNIHHTSAPLDLDGGLPLGRFAEAMSGQLDRFDFSPVSEKRWSTIATCAELLGTTDQPVPAPGTTLIDLLNAAWLAREQDLDHADRIHERLLTAHRNLKPSRRPRGGGPTDRVEKR